MEPLPSAPKFQASWSLLLVCLPPLTSKSGSHWQEAENMEIRANWSLKQFPPESWGVISGFPKTLLTLVLRWLRVLAKTAEWVNCCFPEKAALPAWDWGKGRTEEQSHTYDETTHRNILYVWWRINGMTHQRLFFQQLYRKKPISSGEPQEFQVMIKKIFLKSC